MPFEISYRKTQEIYIKYLSEIGRIKFTFREVDIIACIVHNEREKKIASLLSISPRTVETHVHNIMLKLGCHSKESVTDFIKKSVELPIIKQYYLNLLIQSSFERQLQKIGKTTNRQGCYIHILNCRNLNKTVDDLLQQLKKHLIMANVTLVKATDENNNTKESKCNWYILSQELINSNELRGSNILLLSNDLDLSNINDVEYIDFRQEKDYYFSVLRLLKKIFNISALDQIIQEFNAEYQARFDNQEIDNITNLTIFILRLLKQNLLSSKKLLLISSFVVVVSISWITIQKTFILGTRQRSVRSDFIIPHKNVRLERANIITQIDKNLKSKDKVQSVVLIGIGGAGKTTIARQYASQQNANIVWEINAETENSIIASLEKLAYATAKTTEEKNELNKIQRIKDFNKIREKLILFVKNQLKSYSPWFLIYDNVKSFTDICAYFPHDTNWGTGKVILTTRNSSITNTSYFRNEQVIFLQELSSIEQFDLFTKILKSDLNFVKKEQVQQFLQHIPPFPLDISTTSYYINETGITCEEYLNRKSHNSEEFLLTQSELTKESNYYGKSRYEVIVLSLKHIIAQHVDFPALLLFTSLLDSQSIPRDLLDLYKGKIIIDKFLYNLKKHSMIISDFKNQQIFSFHRNIQTIILDYLIKTLNLKQDRQLIESIATIFIEYLNKLLETKNEAQLRDLYPHLIAFLEKKLASEVTQAYLTSKLGNFYFKVYIDYKKAVSLTEQSLEILSKHYKTPNPKKAWVLGQLGAIYRGLGDWQTSQNYLKKSLIEYTNYYGTENRSEIAQIFTYLATIYRKTDFQKAQNYLEKALSIIKQHDIKTSCIFGNLGRFYRNFGNYKKAKDLLEQDIMIRDNNPVKHKIKYARSIINLGIVYSNLRDDTKAKELIEKGLSIINPLLGDENIEVAWSKIHLGMVYGHLGDWLTTKRLIQKSLEYYTGYYGKDHDSTAWALEKLGVAYRELREYVNSNNVFDQALTIYKKHYGTNSFQIALLLHNLGKMKFLAGDIEAAEEYLKKSYEILTDKKHPKIAGVLESLVALYQQKAKHEDNQGNIVQGQVYHSKAKDFLNELFKILKENFPKDSPHIKEINLKYLNPKP